ncbi:MAG: SCO family protein [Bacteroidetes bacterium]|nr:SCO family protein [Bacteroidota bacterium]
MKKNNFLKIFTVLSIIIVPSIAYYIITPKHPSFIHLPIYGHTSVNEKGDSIYHTIPAFEFTAQDGNIFSSKKLDGQIFVADFFFTTCQSTCPKLSGQLYRIADRYKAMRELTLVSFSVNPEHDSVSVLADYGKKFLVDASKWKLLTGDKKKIYDLARTGFMIPVEKGDGGPEDFIHSDQLVLVDKDKRIRGYYDGTNDKEVDNLMNEIKVLLLENINEK